MSISRKVASCLVAALLASMSLSSCGVGEKDAVDQSSKSSASHPELTKANFVETVIAPQRKAGTNRLELVIESGGQTITSAGSQIIGDTLKENAAEMTMDFGTGGPGEIKLLVVNGQFYMNFGELTGGKYAKADLTDTSDPFTRQLAPMIDQVDATKQVEILAAALTSVSKKGAVKEIDGVETQPYELVLDTTKMDAFDDLQPEARKLVPDLLTYTMYLGQDGLMRRMTYGFSGVKGTMNFSNWGEPVDIKAPAKDEVADKSLSEFLSGGLPTSV